MMKFNSSQFCSRSSCAGALRSGLRATVSVSAVLCASVLAGCASGLNLPDAQQVQSQAQLRPADAWQAPLPHGGSAAQLLNWWTDLGDSVLTQLMQAAQERNAQIAGAVTRMAQARASLAQASQVASPQLAWAAQGSRAVAQPKAQPAGALALGLQASWELDLGGAQGAAYDAAQWRARGAQSGWHAARVAVAAETALSYVNYRYCQSSLALLERQAASRQTSARLAQSSAQAGFAAPIAAQLAQANSWDAANHVADMQAQCDAQIKALVALSAWSEPDLRQKLKENLPQVQKIWAQPALFSVANALPTVPAQLLAQRPDIAAAQARVHAAAQDIRASDARRYPSLSLSGSIAAASARMGGVTQEGATWSLGPVLLHLPLSSQAATRASTQAAVAAYEEAVRSLQASVLQAVREVEESLVQLDATERRSEGSKLAAQANAAALAAAQQRHDAGLASLAELEEARRMALMAEQNHLSVQRERIQAWIFLYRASGGGWTAQTP